MPQIFALGARWAPWEVLGDFSTSGLEPSLQWLRYNIRQWLRYNIRQWLRYNIRRLLRYNIRRLLRYNIRRLLASGGASSKLLGNAGFTDSCAAGFTRLSPRTSHLRSSSPGWSFPSPTPGPGWIYRSLQRLLGAELRWIYTELSPPPPPTVQQNYAGFTRSLSPLSTTYPRSSGCWPAVSPLTTTYPRSRTTLDLHGAFPHSPPPTPGPKVRLRRFYLMPLRRIILLRYVRSDTV